MRVIFLLHGGRSEFVKGIIIIDIYCKKLLSMLKTCLNPSKIGQNGAWSLPGVKLDFMTGKVQVYDGESLSLLRGIFRGRFRDCEL